MTPEPAPRIALFMPSLAGGGAQRVALNLAAAFFSRGLDVDVVVARAEGELVDQVATGVRVVDLGARRTVTALPGLTRYLRETRPAALLSLLSHANVVAALARALARTGTRLVVTQHNTATRAVSHAATLRDRWMPLAMRATYPRADEIVAVSRGVADDLARVLRLDRSRVRAIHNPAFMPEMPARAEEPLDHPWFEPRALPVILGVGRLAPQKDFPTLLRAFGILRQEGCAARLMILGEGPERRRLERLARELGVEEHVALPGFVDNPFAYMRRARLFVLSSTYEGFGNVLVEAMACGTPVVSTDCPNGPAEILEDGRWGHLAPVADPPALARAMARAMDEPVPDVRTRARAFSMDTVAGRYLDLLLPREAPARPA